MFLDNDVCLLSPFQHLKSLVLFNNISITTVLGLSFLFSTTNMEKFSFLVDIFSHIVTGRYLSVLLQSYTF